ncbi:MAG: glycosyltransferase [Nitrospinae bacterium]|nr:glycosyltransferase [Nitrospinota bacterium]
MEKISYHSYSKNKDARFSILIPTWNNLGYLKLCVDSIKKNSRFSHQLILHVNESADGTLEWARGNELDHTFSAKNIGVCYALNAAAALAKTDYIVYVNDDIYVCPDWDYFLWEEIQNLGAIDYMLSSTLIEPNGTGNPCVISASEFGDSIENFREDLLLEKFRQFSKPDWSGGGGTCNVVAKGLWQLVGGYSVEFSPGMNSDPDFFMKLWQVGVRYFKGVSKSRAYHFQCKTTSRVLELNDGRKQFQRKWKLPSSTFKKTYMQMGKKFEGPLSAPKESLALKFDRLRSRLF